LVKVDIEVLTKFYGIDTVFTIGVKS